MTTYELTRLLQSAIDRGVDSTTIIHDLSRYHKYDLNRIQDLREEIEDLQIKKFEELLDGD